MSILNKFIFNVDIYRSGKPYMSFPTWTLNGKNTVHSEISGGAAFAAVKAHRRLITPIDPQGRFITKSLINNMLLLSPGDAMEVIVSLERIKKTFDLGYSAVKGTKFQCPVLQEKEAYDDFAVLHLAKCRFLHLSAEHDYVISMAVQGDAKITAIDETDTSDFQ
jgi:hypothetical protein